MFYLHTENNTIENLGVTPFDIKKYLGLTRVTEDILIVFDESNNTGWYEKKNNTERYYLEDITKLSKAIKLMQELKDNPTLIYNPKLDKNEVDLDKLKDNKIGILNNNRNNEVANMIIELEINNKKIPFNADETSQIRLNRAVTALNDDDTIDWIDANGNIHTLTKQQCLEGIRIAGQKQTEIFIKAAKLKQQVKSASTIEDVEKITWS